MGRLALGALVLAAGVAVLAGLALAVPRSLAARWKMIGRLRGRRWWVYALLVTVSGAAAVFAGMDVVRSSETPEFCGSCHEMKSRHEAWQSSLHAEVTCSDCHAGRGFAGSCLPFS